MKIPVVCLFILLFSSLAFAPPLSSVQAVFPDANHATLTVTTVMWGTLTANISVLGPSWTLTIKKDGVQQAQAILVSPSAATIENSFQASVQNILKDNAIQAVQFRLHIFTLNPIFFTPGLFDASEVVPVDWWNIS